jgi:hypothetical protein
MAMHTAPTIREMDNARVTAGLLINLDSVGYTVTEAQEDAGTRPAPAVVKGFFYFAGSKITPAD